MTQPTYYQLPNEAGLAFRQHLNENLSGQETDFAGAIAPTSTQPFMRWLDTSVSPPVLRRRSIDNLSWELFYVTDDMVGIGGGRTQEDKNLESISVKDFGAVGDGVTDDTAAIQLAINTSKKVLFPANNEFKIKSYVDVPSNRHIIIDGTINFYNRRAGFAVVNRTNVQIEGTKASRIYDSAVNAAFSFNKVLTEEFAPVVHIRANGDGNKSGFVVKGLNVDHVSVGVFVSVAGQNNWLTGGLDLSGADFTVACFDVLCESNNFEYIEGAATAANFAYKTTFKGNRVYRSGDGGIYFISVSQGAIIDNFRESPYGDGGSTTTLNDGQGISIETSSDVIISRNRVIAFQDHGIDVKNRCSRVTITNNILVDCQFASISSRLGDTGSGSGTGAVNYVYIANNEIKNNGFIHTSAYGTIAAIQLDSFYHGVVENNKINGLNACHGIRVTGPGNELISTMSSSPRQSYALIRNNSILWHSTNYDFSPQFALDNTVLDAIKVAGGYLSKVVIEGNSIVGDRYSNSDARANSSYAIRVDVDVTTSIGGGYVWPNSISIKNNQVYGWLGGGMLANSNNNNYAANLEVNGNRFEYCRATGGYIYGVKGIKVVNNTVVRGETSAFYIDTCRDAIVCNNNFVRAGAESSSGADTQQYGLSITNTVNALVSYNVLEGSVSATTTTGNTNVTISNNI